MRGFICVLLLALLMPAIAGAAAPYTLEAPNYKDNPPFTVHSSQLNAKLRTAISSAMTVASSKQCTIGSVLVVGGGIAGMQASLDLANSGYFVYLVEQSPTIGGTMAQIDKTFPTNDCAM